MKSHKIKSKGTGNIGKDQEGLTYYSKEPAVAGSYATSFAPSKNKPSPTKPAYIVSIKKPADSKIKHVEGTGSDEVGVKGHVPASHIVAVHKAKVIAYRPASKVLNKQGETIVKQASDAHVHWEKIK